MSRRSGVLLVVLLSTLTVGGTLAAVGGVPVFVNGEPIPTQGAMQDGVTYVPVRAVAEALGVSVEWDPARRAVYVTGTPTIVQPPPAPTARRDILRFYLQSVVTILSLIIPLFFVLANSLLRYLDDAVKDAHGSDLPKDQLTESRGKVVRFFWTIDAVTYTLSLTGLTTLLAGLVIWYSDDLSSRSPNLSLVQPVLVAGFAANAWLLYRIRVLRGEWTWFNRYWSLLLALALLALVGCAWLAYTKQWDRLMEALFALVVIQLIAWLASGWVHKPLTTLLELRQVALAPPKKRCHHCLSTIPSDATKCAHCTSDLMG